MDIKFTSLHQVDHQQDTPIEIDITNQSADLHDYIKRLIIEITESHNKRGFRFVSDTTEVRIAIGKFLSGEYKEGANINANRLLKIEKTAQGRISHLGRDIQKGSLFQAVIKDHNITTIIISKADHSKFLDEKDFTLKNGLPWEKRIFKAFLVNFDNMVPGELFVYDTTSRMAKYWWDDYLELAEKPIVA